MIVEIERQYIQSFLSRMIFLAFKESSVVGAGQIPDALVPDEHKREQLVFSLATFRDNEINCDYILGRMMKLYITIKDGKVHLPDGEPRPDYQSWCKKYKTYRELANASLSSLGLNN